MQVQPTRWGNSLGIRIPKDIAGRIGLTEGARVDITTGGEVMTISSARPRCTIEEILAA